MVHDEVLELLVAADKATRRHPEILLGRTQHQADLVSAVIVSRALQLNDIEPTVKGIQNSPALRDLGMPPALVYAVATGQNEAGSRRLELALLVSRALGCQVSFDVTRSDPTAQFTPSQH